MGVRLSKDEGCLETWNPLSFVPRIPTRMKPLQLSISCSSVFDRESRTQRSFSRAFHSLSSSSSSVVVVVFKFNQGHRIMIQHGRVTLIIVMSNETKGKGLSQGSDLPQKLTETMFANYSYSFYFNGVMMMIGVKEVKSQPVKSTVKIILNDGERKRDFFKDHRQE